MRRSILAGIGALAVLVFAACSDRPNDRTGVVPTEPSLAKGSSQCAGGFASEIAREQGDLFSAAQMDVLEPLWDDIKAECVVGNTAPSATLLTYLEQVAEYRGDDDRAQDLVDHWGQVTLYATGSAINRSYRVLRPGQLVVAAEGERSGGADVLNGDAGLTQDLELTTFDGQAGVQINAGQSPTGPHLVTMDPDPTQCPSTALNPASPACYNVQIYPPVTTWIPDINIGMCIHGGGTASTGIIHTEGTFGTEVLPDGDSSFPWAGGTCHLTHTVMNTWLGREAGPLGRALAKAIDYLRPQTLLADDAGESGSTDAASPFGGAHLKIIEDNFNDLLPTPDIGDLWTISAVHPGYIRINETGLGDMPGPLVELSQAQGACNNCQAFQLLATRENGTTAESNGIYEVTWTSLQTKTNLKEAPFVFLNAGAPGNNNNNEIARLSYVRTSSVNQLVLTVRGFGNNGNLVQTYNVGTWTQNMSQDFKVTISLNTLGGTATSQKLSLAIDGAPFDFDPGPGSSFIVSAPRAISLKQIGYNLTGIDAGIMASDDWKVIRLADTPP